MRGLFGLLGSACLILAACPAALHAQDLPEAFPEHAETSEAERLGSLIYAYDQAAWHATDSFLADTGRARDFDMSIMRGFIVLPTDNADLLETIFFAEQDGKLVIAASYRVRGSTVVDGGLRAGEDMAELPAAAVRMADARQTAFGAMADERYNLCARSNPNTVVLPAAADGTLSVYILTPMTNNETFPVGGHYRFIIDAEGAIVSHRRFLNTCFAIPLQGQGIGLPEGSRPTAVFVTHLLDEHPTEIHFYASHYVPLTLMVATVDTNLLWQIDQGHLTARGPVPEGAGRQ